MSEPKRTEDLNGDEKVALAVAAVTGPTALAYELEETGLCEEGEGLEGAQRLKKEVELHMETFQRVCRDELLRREEAG